MLKKDGHNFLAGPVAITKHLLKEANHALQGGDSEAEVTIPR